MKSADLKIIHPVAGVVEGTEKTENSAEKGSYSEVNKDESDKKSEKITQDTKVPFRCWVILFISCMGVLMASISSTALIVAFPTLLADLDSSIATMMWILLSLMLLVAGTVGIVGKLGDIFGQATLYKFGLFMFTLGSFIAGFADKKYQGEDLLGARVIIGFGAAFLFTNSSAILTNAFAPYNKVGLCQGIFQISSACGMVVGPVVGGGFAQVNWRWIFFWNVPVGGLCTLLSLWAVQDNGCKLKKTMSEIVRDFDWIGAIFYPTGLSLILVAMIQGVSPTPSLSNTPALITLIVVGAFCGIVFITDQFYAKEPLIPPDIFLKNRIFTVTTVCGTCMALVRNSITYNFIFYLQGPKGQTPLGAGITLIPFGLGVMAAGFISGALSDKIRPGIITTIGCVITLVILIVFLYFDENTPLSVINGMLFLAGIGIGTFGSPNNMSNMLSVHKDQRGIAAAVSMICLMFTSMLGIVLTFSFVLKSMSSADLFDLFIYGGKSLSKHTIENFLYALCDDWYIVIAVCALSVIVSLFNNYVPLKHPTSPPVADKIEETKEGTVADADGTLQKENTITTFQDIEMGIIAGNKEGDNKNTAADVRHGFDEEQQHHNQDPAAYEPVRSSDDALTRSDQDESDLVTGLPMYLNEVPV